METGWIPKDFDCKCDAQKLLNIEFVKNTSNILETILSTKFG
jgi:hypothetical protein